MAADRAADQSYLATLIHLTLVLFVVGIVGYFRKPPTAPTGRA